MMKMVFRLVVTLFLVTVCSSLLCAAGPSAADALKLQPVQPGVDYDQPSEAEIAKCEIRPYKSGKARGWVVQDASGKPLRRFLDSNADNKVDLWCYFRGGVEVYRDIDADYNLKADQHRWMGTAGTRWGIDRDEDGQIDSWKSISAEEVSAEAVAAVAEGSTARLRAILVSRSDLERVGITGDRRDEILEKAKQSLSSLAARTASRVPSSAKWVYFGAIRPGLVPAGAPDVTKDLIVYERTVAIYEVDGRQQELNMGTLIRTPAGWRLIELPTSSGESPARVAATGGYFFQTSMTRPPSAATSTNPQVDPAVQVLLTKLESVDAKLATAATAKAQADLQTERADILESLYEKVATEEERHNWIRQLADTIAAAVQTGQYKDGLSKLQQLEQTISQGDDRNLQAFVHFRLVAARYAQQLAEQGADPAKVQETWLKELDQFVKEFPDAEDAPEAMLQLAVTSEFNGERKAAVQWYERIVADFAMASQAEKASGAIRRINAVGKRINLRARTVDDRNYSLDSDRGKVVVVVYWATWCQPCLEELEQLKALYARYGSRGLRVVTISLDADSSELRAFLAKKRYPFETLYESGGLESRLAQEMGILTLPTTLIVDREGKVVTNSVTAGELESQLRKLLPTKK